MEAVIAETPLPYAAKLEDTTASCGESEDRKCRCWLHDASHLAQSNHGIRKEMKRATAEGGVENAIFEWKGFHSCTGEMHVGNAFLGSVNRALPKHPHGYRSEASHSRGRRRKRHLRMEGLPLVHGRNARWECLPWQCKPRLAEASPWIRRFRTPPSTVTQSAGRKCRGRRQHLARGLRSFGLSEILYRLAA